MPLSKLPKRGSTSQIEKYAIVNLGIIEKFIEAGKLNAKSDITEDVLVESDW